MSYTAAKRRVDICKMGRGKRRGAGGRELWKLCSVQMFGVAQFCSSDITHTKEALQQEDRPIPNVSENPSSVMVSHSASGALFSTPEKARLFRVQQEAPYSLTLKFMFQMSCAMQMYWLMYGKFSLNMLHIVIFRAYIPKTPNVWNSKCLWEKIIPWNTNEKSWIFSFCIY